MMPCTSTWPADDQDMNSSRRKVRAAAWGARDQGTGGIDQSFAGLFEAAAFRLANSVRDEDGVGDGKRVAA